MRVSLTALSLLVLGPSCIPSHRLVHDGDRYFERCYAADFEPRVALPQKEACWQAWMAHYTRHQPAQHVDYAMRRIEALQSGEPPLTLRAQPRAPALASAAGPLPAAPPSYGPADAGPVPNGCVEACAAYEARCAQHCPDDSASCRHGCIRERAICLGGCH